MTSRTVMLSSSMALWIISSCEVGNLAELAAGGDDELEFVGGVNGAAAAGVARAEEAQDQAAGAAHEKK